MVCYYTTVKTKSNIHGTNRTKMWACIQLVSEAEGMCNHCDQATYDDWFIRVIDNAEKGLH